MTEADHLPRLSSGAQRMRRYRERRQRGLSCIKVQLRRSEVDALIACKLLEPTEREDRRALAPEVHRYLDANHRTPPVTRNASTVTCHSRLRDTGHASWYL